ncbi:MAG TPA: cation:proton antiporter [Terriglobales bacterium]|nr:cation:proton antiporter [Terriglobales bacterium]
MRTAAITIAAATLHASAAHAAEATTHDSDLLTGIGLSIIAATVFAFLARALRQPLLLAYLAAGAVLGPELGLGLVSDHRTVELISEIGLILLLFIIGLEIDVRKLWIAGRSLVLAGVFQFIGCVALGVAFVELSGAAGDGRYDTFYLAVAMALSSTMVVVKLLYDKLELATLPGRLTLGILVFQDLWAILVLALQPNLDNPQVTVLLGSLIKGAGLVVAGLACSRYLLPPLFATVAKQPEVMLIAALAWCFAMAGVASAAGLSREMGALIAGVSISSFPYNVDVAAKVINLRDFFVTLFFVSLGMTITMPTLPLLALALLASAFLIASRFLTIFPILYATGNGLRTSLLPSINLAQMSEFSLVIVNLGAGFGHVSPQVASLLTFVFAITAIVSTYLITYNHPLQKRLGGLLQRLGLHDPQLGTALSSGGEHPPPAIVFLGFFREASSILHELLDGGECERLIPRDRLMVVDFNPDVHRALNQRNVPCMYGDIASMETLQHAHITEAKLVVCTLPDSILKGLDNRRMLRQLRRVAPKAQVVVASETIHGALALYDEGADFVVIPRLHSARYLAETLAGATGMALDELRQREREALRQRNEVLP